MIDFPRCIDGIAPGSADNLCCSCAYLLKLQRAIVHDGQHNCSNERQFISMIKIIYLTKESVQTSSDSLHFILQKLTVSLLPMMLPKDFTSDFNGSCLSSKIMLVEIIFSFFLCRTWLYSPLLGMFHFLHHNTTWSMASCRLLCIYL